MFNLFDPLYSIIQYLVRFYFRIFLGLRIYGKKPDLSQNIIIAANHRSFNDPPLMGVLYPNRKLCFIARDDLFTANPFFGWLLKFLYAIPIKPKSADRTALNIAIEKLKDGWDLVIFPEGTRNKTKKPFLKPLPGTGFIALKAQKNVLPVYIENANADYWKQVLRIKPVKVFVGDIYNIPNMEANMRNSVIVTKEIMKRIEFLYKQYGEKNETHSS